MEYFQGANMSAKTPEQMIKEFTAIQRFKEEELVQSQLNQAPQNELEDMINDAAADDDNEEVKEMSPTRPGAGRLIDGRASPDNR